MGLSRKLRIVSGVILGVGFLLGIYMGDVYAKKKINPLFPSGSVIGWERECNDFFCIDVPITINSSSSSKKVPNTNAILITWGIAGTIAAAAFYSAKYIDNK